MLSIYAPQLIPNVEEKCHQFLYRLRVVIRQPLIPLGINDFSVLMERANRIELDLEATQRRRDIHVRRISKGSKFPQSSQNLIPLPCRREQRFLSISGNPGRPPLMANGKSSNPENQALRSGVRSGLKRELAFALQSQASLPDSLSRTPGGPAAAFPAASRSRGAKRSRKSNASEENRTICGPDAAVSIGVGNIPSGGVAAEVAIVNTIKEGSQNGAMDAPTSSENIQGLDKDGLSLNALVFDDSNEGLEDEVPLEKPVVMYKRSVIKSKLDNFAKTPLPPSPFPSLQPVSVAPESLFESDKDKASGCHLENGPAMEHPIVSKRRSDYKIDNGGAEKRTRRFTRSALKLNPVTKTPIAIEQEQNHVEVMPSSATSLTVEQEENPVEVMPFSATSLTVKQEENLVEIPIILDEHGGLEFENGHLDGSLKTEIEGPVAVTIASGSGENLYLNEMDDASQLEKPSRRFMKSVLKGAIETPANAEGFTSTSCDSVGSEELKGDTYTLSESLSMTPKCKMELKMSKKITLTKLPSNVRDLLGTGLLEGLPVKYISCIGKNFGLQGVIRGNRILCSCPSCQGTNAVSAYQFEVHAGSTKKHPSDFIFLENGKSLRDVLKSCIGAPLDMLEVVIQNAIGPSPPKNLHVCKKCKEAFDTARTGNFALLCDSCLEISPRPATPTTSNGMTNSSKKVCVPTASDGKPKSISLQKRPSYGKLTRKDLGLHKLVFMDDILPQGTEVGYYVRGKKLLNGYIKDSGIFCCCCNNVVSPSQFEAHAGQASRRKPYNYIYTSNGVSLHELSVSLSKGRKLSPTENDDLCGICADGGDLLLCDRCPRAFHKECVGLSSIPNGDWYCQYCENLHQKEKHLAHNDNAIAAGRVAGVDPIEQIMTRCIRIVTTPENDAGACALCRQHAFSRTGFDRYTVIICDQCETEYHVGCLRDNNMADLKELPEGEWFCCPDCSRIHSTLHELLRQEPQVLEDLDADIIKKKLDEKGLSSDSAADVRWKLLSGKHDPECSKHLLSQTVSLFHESFDPIVEPISGRDLIPFMVYGRNMRDQDFGGMYCMALTLNSSVISTGLLRVLGRGVAELPLVATKREYRGLGFFQFLFSCIKRLLNSLNVKHFVLPAAEEAESIWTEKFGFSKVTPAQLREYVKGARPMSFHGTSMLHRQQELALVPDEGAIEQPS
ncbi:uncharacterized protein LOC110030435 [Phalaenopsis equestris]|uniref:uncharacterized protein LOC110030435 n=1 Tax=Phalaenopsis equestris TaxID=78828 RepID=UPI0009E48FA3|nr:uncharacterized protein LOC110030435 [Phalaenopsis equestris]